MGKRGNPRRRARLKRKLAISEHVCWLCLFPLDLTLDWHDALAVEIDEEIPASKGGDIYGVHTPCHLVHRCCNLKKGDKILEHGALHEWMCQNLKVPSNDYEQGSKNKIQQCACPSTSRNW